MDLQSRSSHFSVLMYHIPNKYHSLFPHAFHFPNSQKLKKKFLFSCFFCVIHMGIEFHKYLIEQKLICEMVLSLVSKLLIFCDQTTLTFFLFSLLISINRGLCYWWLLLNLTLYVLLMVSILKYVSLFFLYSKYYINGINVIHVFQA